MIGRVIVDGFKFGFSLKRMLPYVFLNLLFLYTVCDMLGRIGTIELTPEALASIAPLYGLYLFIFFFFGISQPLLIAVMLHQAKNFGKKVPMKKSFRFAFSVFLKSFLILIILICVHTLLGFIPFLWLDLVLMALFALASFYVYPAAIVDGKGIVESFKKSFSIFKKAPFKTFIIALLIALVSFVLIAISLFPLMFWLGGNLYSLFQQTQDPEILAEYLARLLMSPTIIPFLLIPSVALAFCQVMKIGMTARLYSALKKKA
ncbi:MAG: hypothetical protein QXU74_02940 [Candidatus Aenigmatarchaeota archaeon]